jgi:hypothetical protein
MESSHPYYQNADQGRVALRPPHSSHAHSSGNLPAQRKRRRQEEVLQGVVTTKCTLRDREVKNVLDKIFLCVNASLGLCAVDETLLLGDEVSEAASSSSSSAPFWCQVRTFGSRALNANLPGGDLDVIVLTPLTAHFDLFGAFSSECIPRVGGRVLCKVRSARVPVLKLSLDGFDIDLLSVPVNSDEPLSDQQIRSPGVFDKVPPEYHTSLNGIRTVLEIKACISGRWRMFGSVLRRIKIWAKGMYFTATKPFHPYPSHPSHDCVSLFGREQVVLWLTMGAKEDYLARSKNSRRPSPPKTKLNPLIFCLQKHFGFLSLATNTIRQSALF